MGKETEGAMKEGLGATTVDTGDWAPASASHLPPLGKDAGGVLPEPGTTGRRATDAKTAAPVSATHLTPPRADVGGTITATYVASRGKSRNAGNQWAPGSASHLPPLNKEPGGMLSRAWHAVLPKIGRGDDGPSRLPTPPSSKTRG